VLYLAYNRSAREDAEKSFGPNTECKTIDALAYKYIIRDGASMNGIRVGPRKIDWFTWRNVDIDLRYDEKLKLIETMEIYFASNFISLKTYLTETGIDKNITDGVTKYVQQMAKKEIPCTFGFAKKYLHILMSRNVVVVPEVDLVILDEIQDSPQVTLEIFKLLPAKRKLGLGDQNQSIYNFSYCVDGFQYLHDVADTQLSLTTSYRVDKEIAKDIQVFGRKYLQSSMVFEGIEYEDRTINNSMFISRTNGSLIAKMMEMNKQGIQYNLTRPAKEIFSLLLTIISLKPGCKIYHQPSKFLLQDMEEYNRSETIRTRHRTLFSYIASKHAKDKSIKTACSTIVKYGGQAIFKCFDIAKSHEAAKVKHHLTLTTAHSSKGLQSDKVIIADDMFPSFLTEEGTMSEEDMEQELKLIYVAVSRCKKELSGANWLTQV